jgi:hypothetical protein
VDRRHEAFKGGVHQGRISVNSHILNKEKGRALTPRPFKIIYALLFVVCPAEFFAALVRVRIDEDTLVATIEGIVIAVIALLAFLHHAISAKMAV